MVGHPASWDLQYSLGQAVSTEGNTNQDMTFAAGQSFGGVQRKYRQNDEQPQHAQAVNTG